MKRLIILFIALLLMGSVYLYNVKSPLPMSQKPVVALTVIVTGKTPAEIALIKAEIQKVVEKYGYKVDEVPLDDLIRKKMGTIK